jgi:SAM-dependent methyltransferase
MKKVDFDQYADKYNELLRDGTRFFSEDESYFARYKVGIVRGLVPRSPARILEFGCGIGRNMPYLREAFPDAELMGSDVSARSIETAREQNPGIRFWVDGEDAGDEGLVDLVFIAGVFHHIPPEERTQAAARVCARVRPGGSVVVFEHNPYNPVTRRIVRDCPYDEGVVLLRPPEMAGLLRGAGFRVRRRRFSLFFPPKLKSLTALEPMLSWLPLGGQYWICADRP